MWHCVVGLFVRHNVCSQSQNTALKIKEEFFLLMSGRTHIQNEHQKSENQILISEKVSDITDINLNLKKN
jgi:hypothetical protein